MQIQKRVFIIHGWCGYPEEGWFPWLKAELEKKNFSTLIPQMPSTRNPVFSEWLDTIKKLVGEPDSQTFFVGHSLGCVTIVRYLEQLPADVRIGGCVFVAGFSNNVFVPEIEEFYTLPIDFDKVKSHANKFITILSDNDDAVSLDTGKEFQLLLNAKLIVEHNKGHFSGGDGIIELPVALESMLEITRESQ
jgi:uncharacterized protein